MNIDKTLHILIVEDDEINRKLLASILKTIGFTNVSQAENGQIAWDIIQEDSVDLVMTDWMMPEMDGLELLKKIRQAGNAMMNLPVIMITALGKQENIMKAAEWDINGYVVKPFSVNTVLSKIEEIMEPS